jgi:hypothetical protein
LPEQTGTCGSAAIGRCHWQGRCSKDRDGSPLLREAPVATPSRLFVAARRLMMPGTFLPTARNSVGNSPTIVARAKNCDDRRPVSRTTIAWARKPPGAAQTR